MKWLHVVCDQTKGELSSERKEKCETMQHNFQKLLHTTQTLAVSCVVLMMMMMMIIINKVLIKVTLNTVIAGALYMVSG